MSNQSEAEKQAYQQHQINQLEKLKGHILENAEELGVVLDKAEKQEPVMGVEVKRIASGGFIGNVWWIHENLQEGVFHLYTHPQPKQEPLTDEQITKAFNEAMALRPKEASNAETNRLFVKRIEAAHGIKE